ncbi:MAG TPA: LapA family protein [Candidatus Binatia bacterium]|nr:LapA family protein [Candidatus Binatia bacterium]
MSQTTLSVGFTTVEAPLALILIGIAGLLTLLFLIYVVYLQSSALLESRRHTRELQVEREMAEQAEASRFIQLRSFLETELGKLANQTEECRAGVLARLDQLEGNLRSAVDQSGNTLAAYIGEIEDRLERTAGGTVPDKPR